MIGKILGARYQIQEKIGDGGMALVYKGIDTLLGRTVTIKVLRENLTGDEELVRSFRREAHSAASLSHPNIVNVYDVGHEGNIYYIIMEYIDGKTLKEMIVEEGRLDPSQAVYIAIRICEALEDAHRHNIIHRDIKPHNILTTREGRVKVTDFGIARAVTSATITYTRSIIGSVHYFSPEQARGGLADAKSDIYSLGIVLYEMLTGTIPFSGDSPVSIALKHVQEEITPPSEINEDLPSELEDLVMKAVEKDPEDRYESVQDLKRELKELEGQLKSSVVPNPKDKNTMQARRKKQKKGKNRTPLYVAIGIILILVLFFSGLLLLRSFLTVPEVVVPDVEGLTLTQATDKLQALGLTFAVEQAPSRDVPSGHVISQDPPAGRTVRQERTVMLVLSTGPSYIIVPGVIGKSELEARIALQAADFVVDIIESFSNEVSNGLIVDQSPSEGARLLKGDTVKVYVSKGGQPVKVKDLRGLSEEEAKRWIESYNLELSYVVYLSDLAPEGQVIDQFPEPGEVLQMGDPIDLVVSEGPDIEMLQEYQISIDITQDNQVAEGEVVEVIVKDVLGERSETMLYTGEVIIVKGFEKGTVTIKHQGLELATQKFPN